MDLPELPTFPELSPEEARVLTPADYTVFGVTLATLILRALTWWTRIAALRRQGDEGADDAVARLTDPNRAALDEGLDYVEAALERLRELV